jgi:hypothetical protein
MARYGFSNFTRSDIMKDVFDAELFDGKTFGDMGRGLPRILINSTTLSEGKRFVFSEEQFRALTPFRSRTPSWRRAPSPERSMTSR